jgi:hypothetical protein
MKFSCSLSIRHPGESWDPLNKRSAGSIQIERILWIPAFAGMTKVEGAAISYFSSLSSEY